MRTATRFEPHAGMIKVVIAALLVATASWWSLADPPVEVGPSPSRSGRVLILLHGHGAAKNDLVPLARKLAMVAPRVTFLMPSAPHRRGGGRTWYPSFTAASQAAVDARLLELRAEAREAVWNIIDELRGAGVPPEQIYVGGFSQGATVALDVVMSSPSGVPLGGLVSLSGGALELDLAPLGTIASLRAFVSHGKSDAVLGSGLSLALATGLEGASHRVELKEFEGGHEIPDEVVEALGQFIAAR